MTPRRAHFISIGLTAFLLLLVAIAAMLLEMVALNGVSESKGTVALGIGLFFQLFVVASAAAISGWLSKILILQYRWKEVTAIILAVLSTAAVGTAASFFSIMAAILAAGVKI